MLSATPNGCCESFSGRATANEPDRVDWFVACIPHAVRKVRFKANRVVRLQQKGVESNFNAKSPLEDDTVLGAIVRLHLRLGMTAADVNNCFHELDVDICPRRQAFPAKAVLQLYASPVTGTLNKSVRASFGIQKSMTDGIVRRMLAGIRSIARLCFTLR